MEVVIINHFHDTSLNGNWRNEKPSRLEIGNNVYIGYRAMILPQVKKIRDNAVIGAGSVVTRDIPKKPRVREREDRID